MCRQRGALSLIVVLSAVAFAAGIAQAQTKGPAATSTIICWKDKAGKTVGCGDKVPPEYQDNATKELNQRGVVVKQSEAALTPEQRKAQQAELDRKQAEELAKKEQRRKDTALLETFSTDKEIDLKRDREVQLLQSNIETLQSNLKNASDRQASSRASIEQANKTKQPVAQSAQADFDRFEGEKIKTQGQIAQKRKEITDLIQTYAEMKKRFIELKNSSAGAGAAPATSATPAKK